MIGDPKYKAIIPAVIKWSGGNKDGVIEEHPKCQTCRHFTPQYREASCSHDAGKKYASANDYCNEHPALLGEE